MLSLREEHGTIVLAILGALHRKDCLFSLGIKPGIWTATLGLLFDVVCHAKDLKNSSTSRAEYRRIG